MKKSKLITAIVLNLIIFAVTGGVVLSFFCGNTDEIIQSGEMSFVYFTIDANVLAAIAALTAVIGEVRILRCRAQELPKAVVLLKYMATVGLALTFLVVVCYLIPVYGVYTELHDENVHLHVMAPVFCFMTTVFLERSHRITLLESFLGLLPEVIYGIVYFIMVVIIGESRGGWTDFYQFNVGGRWYLTAAAILAFSYGICTAVRLLHNKLTR